MSSYSLAYIQQLSQSEEMGAIRGEMWCEAVMMETEQGK